jgi:hypothetical protein
LQVEAAIVHAYVTRMSEYRADIVSPMSLCSSWLRQSRRDHRPAAARAIVLTNQKGAVLELSGRQVGLMANAD